MKIQSLFDIVVAVDAHNFGRDHNVLTLQFRCVCLFFPCSARGGGVYFQNIEPMSAQFLSED